MYPGFGLFVYPYNLALDTPKNKGNVGCAKYVVAVVCDFSGHEGRGMFTELTVEAPAAN